MSLNIEKRIFHPKRKRLIWRITATVTFAYILANDKLASLSMVRKAGNNIFFIQGADAIKSDDISKSQLSQIQFDVDKGTVYDSDSFSQKPSLQTSSHVDVATTRRQELTTEDDISIIEDQDDDQKLVQEIFSIETKSINQNGDTISSGSKQETSSNRIHKASLDKSKLLSSDENTLYQAHKPTTTGMEIERYYNQKDGTVNDIIVVATIDGTFYGLCRNTGKTLWKRNSNQNENDNITTQSSVPDSSHDLLQEMLHSSTTSSSSSDHETFSENKFAEHVESAFAPLISTSTKRSARTNFKTTAVPSIDGRVYITPGKKSMGFSFDQKNNLHRDHYTSTEITNTEDIRDLINRSPFVDAQGNFFVGSRRTSILALNLNTGKVVRFLTDSGNVEYTNQLLENEILRNQDQNDDERNKNVMWIGRVDYSVVVYDTSSGEIDVRFSTSEILSMDEMINGIGSSSESNEDSSLFFGVNNKNLWNKNSLLTLPLGQKQSSFQYSQNESFNNIIMSSSIISTPNGKLAMRNPETGDILWITNDPFDTPVAYAVESMTGRSLNVALLPDAPSSVRFSKEYLTREFDRQIETLKDKSKSNVNNNDSFDDETVFGALQNGELFALPIGQRRQSSALPHVHLLSSTAGSMSKFLTSSVPQVAHHTDLQHILDNRSKAVSSILKNSYCDPSSPFYQQCLLRSSYEVQKLLPMGDGYYSSDFIENLHNHTNKQKSGFRTFIMIMTSWIPPVVALVFVLSFEMGRRERIRVENKMKAERADSTGKELTNRDKDVSSASLILTKSLSNLSSNQRTGVIQVSEEVLGFGGHGTVVYKGKLDGRFVAVKRMLKAYHASAEREISLLIESDGHPNVVRYFLKEFKGDFVYLALELCDMSLQELIVSLVKHRIKTSIQKQQNLNTGDNNNTIQSAVKKILLDIALGVKHIHSLRIVHRDLKPQNILLAKISKPGNQFVPPLMIEDNESSGDVNILSFLAQDYVAKISDMGLGKQLTGQSSFGLTSMNQSLGVGGSSHDASTIAGVGPGSVGWQAPEVMAQRLSPVSPYQMQGDLNGSEVMLEASPLDAPSNGGRTSRAVDIFSLGCIFYCTLLPGCHPFGEWYEREANIMKNNPSIEDLESISREAYDLVRSMIERNPKDRPIASQICDHPFFWDSVKRVSFLCDLSDRLESDKLHDNVNDSVSPLDRLAIERQAVYVIGCAWDEKIHPELYSNVNKFRSYDQSSIRDLLRLIRNKYHHFDELPTDMKEQIFSSKKESLIQYFEKVFPRLLMHCFNFCRDQLSVDDLLAVKYDIVPDAKKALKRSMIVSQQLSNISSDTSTFTNRVSDDGDDATDKVSAYRESPITEVSTDDTENIENESLIVTNPPNSYQLSSHDIIIWENSETSSELSCRGWVRSDNEWTRRSNEKLRKQNSNLKRCAEDPKFRTRLCNHWDISQGTHCPMRQKNKCVFAHGPVELRVKEGKRSRWGKLVDKEGNNNNKNHSGGEDTYGAARQIETARQGEGKWKQSESTPSKSKKKKE